MATGFKHINSTIKYIIPKFSGRLPYDDYNLAGFWCISIILLPILFAIPIIPFMTLMPHQEISTAVIVAVVITLIFLIFGGVSWISLSVRRLHDTGRSGHWLWLCLISVLSIIPMILMLGDSVADNQYGTGTGKSELKTFSDLKKAFFDIFRPIQDRLTYKEFALSCVILNFLFSSVVAILYFIGMIIMAFLSLSSIMNHTMEQMELVLMDPSLKTGMIVMSCLMGAAVAVYLVFFVKLGIRRLHDTGRSGLNFLWSLIPFIGFCIPLLQIFCDTDESDNQWGPNKLQPVSAHTDEIREEEEEVVKNHPEEPPKHRKSEVIW